MRRCGIRQPYAEAAKRSFNRVIGHLENSKVPIVLITAFKTDRDEDEKKNFLLNREENQRLSGILSRMGDSVIPVLGR